MALFEPEGSIDVYGFGDNSQRQLGVDVSEPQTFPRLIDKLVSRNVLLIACGAEHSVAVCKDSTVYVWGNNTNGRLGLGHETAVRVPAELLLPEPVTAVACGEAFSLFLLSGGRVMATGYNRWGQLGLGDVRDRHTPVTILGIPDRVVQIACGSMHAAAVTAAGELYTWGCGLSGQLGFESTSAEPHPRRVPLPGPQTAARLVACGAAHTLVSTTAGQLFAFGANNVGQLGLPRGSTDDRLHRPTPVSALRGDVLALSCGALHSVVQTTAGVFAFGRGHRGRLGTGGGTDLDVPTPVRGLDGLRIVQFACGEAVSCFVTDTGQLLMCGASPVGDRLVPTADDTLALDRLARVRRAARRVQCGRAHVLLLVTRGAVPALESRGWAVSTMQPPLEAPVPPPSPIQAPSPFARPASAGSLRTPVRPPTPGMGDPYPDRSAAAAGGGLLPFSSLVTSFYRVPDSPDTSAGPKDTPPSRPAEAIRPAASSARGTLLRPRSAVPSSPRLALSVPLSQMRPAPPPGSPAAATAPATPRTPLARPASALALRSAVASPARFGSPWGEGSSR